MFSTLVAFLSVIHRLLRKIPRVNRQKNADRPSAIIHCTAMFELSFFSATKYASTLIANAESRKL